MWGKRRVFSVCRGIKRFIYSSLQVFRLRNMPKRVLIAEDDETIRNLVRAQIDELAGFDVCASVANGLEAVETAIALRPDVLCKFLVIRR